MASVFPGYTLPDELRVLKEQIGLVVSGINSSSYCVALHMEILRGFGIEKPLGRKLATDYAAAPVGEKAQALFRFAEKLTRKPFDFEQEEVDGVASSQSIAAEAAVDRRESAGRNAGHVEDVVAATGGKVQEAHGQVLQA